MLQPGDVFVVDLFGKKEGGTIVGDNLFYYIMKATQGGGLVVDGGFRDLDGIAEMDMPCYYRTPIPAPSPAPRWPALTSPSASATPRSCLATSPIGTGKASRLSRRKLAGTDRGRRRYHARSR